MTIKRGKQPFTESCICGSIADACLKDLRINRAPNGFPRIEAARNPSDEKYTNTQTFGSRDTFKVTLSINKDVSSAINLTHQEAHDHVKRFRNNEAVDDQLFKLVQKALSELEGDDL